MSRRKSSGKIRVIHFSPALEQGGLEKLQIEFARYADRDRFELEFLALQYGGQTVDELEALGFPVRVLNKPPGLRPFKVLELARSFRKSRIDVLHTHNSGPLIYGAPAARIARVPVVVHTRHHGRDYIVNHREVALATAATKLADQVVCVSENSLQEGLIDGIHPQRLKVIWNGIDVSRFDYRGPDPAGPAVVVARLRPEKSLDTLLRALSLILLEIPDYRIEIAGDGQLENELKALASELNLGDHVLFLGNVIDVPSLLSRSSVLVLPSLTEGISLTLLEAMARGLPVVTTRVGGNPEVVDDGKTGLLVPSADPRALADALIQMHRDPERARQMGIAGAQRIEQHFNVRRMVADYERLYLELLRKRRPRHVTWRVEPPESRIEASPVGQTQT